MGQKLGNEAVTFDADDLRDADEVMAEINAHGCSVIRVTKDAAGRSACPTAALHLVTISRALGLFDCLSVPIYALAPSHPEEFRPESKWPACFRCYPAKAWRFRPAVCQTPPAAAEPARNAKTRQ